MISGGDGGRGGQVSNSAAAPAVPTAAEIAAAEEARAAARAAIQAKVAASMKVLDGSIEGQEKVALCNLYCSDANYGAAAKYVSAPKNIAYLTNIYFGYAGAVSALQRAAKRYESDYNSYWNAPKRTAIVETITAIQAQQIAELTNDFVELKKSLEPPVCGNKKVERGEQCDDGNTKKRDGCSDTCQKEAPRPRVRPAPATPAPAEAPPPVEEAPAVEEAPPPVEESAPPPVETSPTPAPQRVPRSIPLPRFPETLDRK